MKYIIALLLFFFPTRLVDIFCKVVRYDGLLVKKGSIGFSLVIVDKIELVGKSRIGHLNFIKCKSLRMDDSKIYHMNFIRGNFAVEMGKEAWINSQNKISSIADSYHDVLLHMGKYAKIGVRHLLDMTDSISIGDYSMLAGADTQIWTHNYFFSKTTGKTVREDSPVYVGRNSYIGARCTIMAGVEIGDAVTVGAHCCVSKSVIRQGLYVGQGLRFIEFDPDKRIRLMGTPAYGENIFRRHKNEADNYKSQL